ncbi:MAG: adenylyltransferase/cytidyltransferase family protein [Methanomicrobiales archaeon]
MIGISADFDPVHNGHVKLIEKGREIADKNGEEVVIYLNKDYSANHAPFFVNYEARSKMALDAGADRIVPIEGLHYRLTLAYTVPIRIAMMIEDGVEDYVDAADVSTSKIQKYASSFASKGIFSGIPRSLPNRNVIRWFAVNEFLKGRYQRKMKFHIIPEAKVDGKISGREIRKKIISNNFIIPDEVKKLLPHSSIEILEDEIEKGNVPGKRNTDVLMRRLNNYSRSKLLKIAHLNADAVDVIIKGRRYGKESQVWSSLRMAGYGPVLTRLALSAVEEKVTRLEVLEILKKYEKNGIIPPDQTIEQVIERAWYVAYNVSQGIKSSDAHKKFRKGNRIDQKPPYLIEGGLHLRSFELDSLEEGMNALIYVDKNGILCCEIKTADRKIKSPLRLPGVHATFLRFIIDSHFIPLEAKLSKKKRGWRIIINVLK